MTLAVAAASSPSSAQAQPAPSVDGGASAEVRVRGHSHIPSRGIGDYEIPIGKLALVPRADAASLLRLAPGTFLTNAGGAGHPYQIFLRGFDAREGQDLEIAVDGVPVNEVGNPHGNGLADTHFVIPELVRRLRVIEGPFAPQQGNFAVAGSALYDLGLDDPGLAVRTTVGSFGTKRLLLTWKPNGAREHTFGGAEVFTSDGYGQNRASERATANAGYEGTLGRTGLYRFLLTTYGTHYGSAGVLRADDVASGRRDFFATYDATQGGDAARHSASVVLEERVGEMQFTQQAWIVLRAFRLRENLTGFVGDPQQSWQSEHPQRGDLFDQTSRTLGVGARGSGRTRAEALGQRQELELGYFARHDDVDAAQTRNRAGTVVPYRTDLALQSALTNVGIYADASLKPGIRWLTFRGGGRVDWFGYEVSDRCAQRTRESMSAVALDTECFTSDRTGYRSAEQRVSTSAVRVQPRMTALVGPFDGFTMSVSHGLGSRSFDPQYVNQGLKTPFAEVVASEGGIAFRRAVGPVDLTAGSVFFRTHVGRDLVFDESEGRNTLADGTTRAGWAGNARATTENVDLAGSATLVRATFDDTNLLVPYAPPVVLRADGAAFGELPFRVGGRRLVGSIGAGISYVGRRPLPLGERASTIFTVDVAANVRWQSVALGLACTNLLDRRYRLAEYNYVSDFRSQAYPTLVASRHFAAGEPRAVFATLTLTFGGEEGS